MTHVHYYRWIKCCYFIHKVANHQSLLLANTVCCLPFMVKMFHVFCRLFCNFKSSFMNVCSWILWKLVKAGNRKSLSGMKVKTWNTVNNKQYMVFHLIWYPYSACSLNLNSCTTLIDLCALNSYMMHILRD